MNLSLRKLLRCNRGGLYKFKKSIGVQAPIDPPITGGGYVLSDFGENAINNHYPSDSVHSSKVQNIFNYVVAEFSHRCTSYESFNIPSVSGGFVGTSSTLEVAAMVDADIIMTPYVNASSYREYEYYDFVLPVSSHYDNAGSDGNPTNSNRRDITAGPDVLLVNSVAVSARRDTPSTLEESTSFGYGMEFFEDISPEAMNPIYPEKAIPTAFAELISADGITFTSSVHLDFTKYIQVGEEISIRRPGQPEEFYTVKTINGLASFTINEAASPITVGNIYGWHKVTLASYCGGQAQSWAVPLVAGKLKVIKMTTMKDWDTVRAAARATAKRNPTGIPEIDNSNWDMYRGFGCIDVQAAINYINNNQ